MRRWGMAVAAVALLAPVAALPQSKSGGNSGVYEQLNLFGEAFERIRHDAVEPVTDNRLIETAITGMLTSLDPHSGYISESDYKAMQSKSPEESASAGLVVTWDGGQVKVVSPRDGSPAATAGIKPGDMIFTIDKEPTYDMTLPEVEQKLRGAPGSEVALVLRRGNSGPIDAKLKRSDEKFPTVSSRIEGGDVGYIRVAAFDDATADAVANAVKDLRQQGGGKLAGLIVDLRNNPGGKFDAAVATADAFIDKGDITVVQSRKADTAKRIAATPGDVANGQAIVALVNGGTAREAELVAGALQDNKRAVLLGSKTFGESAIESVIPLNGKGAVRLTTARFQTPGGRTIQGKGIEPDLSVSPLKLEKVSQADRRREADLRGALKNPENVPPAGGATPKTPATSPAKPAETTATPPKGDQPTVATGDMGTPSDEQLSEAIDVLHGLALTSGRTAQR